MNEDSVDSVDSVVRDYSVSSSEYPLSRFGEMGSRRAGPRCAGPYPTEDALTLSVPDPEPNLTNRNPTPYPRPQPLPAAPIPNPNPNLYLSHHPHR